MAKKNDYEFGRVYALGDIISKHSINERNAPCLSLKLTGNDFSYEVFIPDDMASAIDLIDGNVVLGTLYSDEEVKTKAPSKKEKTNYLVLYDDTVESTHLYDHLKFVKVKDYDCPNRVFLLEQMGGKLIKGEQKHIVTYPTPEPKWGTKYQINNAWDNIADRVQVVLSILSKYNYESATIDEREIMLITRHNIMDALMNKAEEEVYSTYGYDTFVRDYYSADAQGFNIAKLPLYLSGDSNVREYSKFVSSCKKMVQKGSLSDAIEFYEREPKRLKAKYKDRTKENEAIELARQNREQKREQTKQNAENKRKQELFKL